MEEVKLRNKRLKDDMQKLQEETKKLVEKNESLERQKVKVKHNSELEVVVRVEVKGKGKKGASQVNLESHIRLLRLMTSITLPKLGCSPRKQ